MSSLLIRNGEVVTEEGRFQKDLLIEGGILTKVAPGLPEDADEIINATDLLIFPGFIDCHVHFREPGYEDAEDMASGAKAARGGPARHGSDRSGGGGVTTVCEMPNTNPPTCTVKALQDKRARAKAITDCDIRFFFGVTKHEHLEELAKVEQSDICGVKLYLGHSTGNQKVEEGTTEEVFKICAERKIPLVCHCEDEEIIKQNEDKVRRGVALRRPVDSREDEKSVEAISRPGRASSAPLRSIRLHSEIRSVESAVKSTTHAIDLAKKHGTHLHIAHLSTKDELALIKQAKEEGLPITCEVAPHHLFLSIDDYESLGTLAKMNPPLRTKDHCSALWKGVLDGTVDCIATDHAPHTLAAKQGLTPHTASEVLNTDTKSPLDAPSGVPGVETMVPLLLSHGLPPKDLLRLCHTNPNRIFNLGKPKITPDKPANLTLVNPRETWTIHGKELHSKCGWTPYEGWEITGKIERVITQ